MKLATLLSLTLIACTKGVTVSNETALEKPAAPTIVETNGWTLTLPPRCDIDPETPVTERSMLARCRSYSQHFVTVSITTKDWSDDMPPYELVAIEAVERLPNTSVFGKALYKLKDALASVTYFVMNNAEIGTALVAVEDRGIAYNVSCGTAFRPEQGLSTLDAACTDIVRSFQLK